MNDVSKKSKIKDLRRKAEELLKKKSLKRTSKPREIEILKLIHELEVHQIELELQNEELALAKKLNEEAATEKYAELYDFAPSGYFTLSKNGDIIELNLCGSQMLGKERSSLINLRFIRFVTPDTKKNFNQFLSQVFKSKAKESCDIALIVDSLALVYVHLNAISTENGKQCLVTAVDITERKLAEHDLIKAKDKAVESDRLKTAFLQNMSHEIRTPMNAIVGFAQMLKRSSLTPEKKESYTNIIVENTNHLLLIVTDILTISSLETKQEKVSIKQVCINKIVDDLHTIFFRQAASKNLEIQCEQELTNEQSEIYTDKVKVIQVLSNLLTNAVKFTQEGFIEFGYSLKKDMLEFYVKDSGIGIDEKNHNLIFERFRQGFDQVDKKYGGTGLGLSISKAFVELLGGSIWVASKPDNGSIFYFTIPYKPANELKNPNYKSKKIKIDVDSR